MQEVQNNIISLLPLFFRKSLGAKGDARYEETFCTVYARLAHQPTWSKGPSTYYEGADEMTFICSLFSQGRVAAERERAGGGYFASIFPFTLHPFPRDALNPASHSRVRAQYCLKQFALVRGRCALFNEMERFYLHFLALAVAARIEWSHTWPGERGRWSSKRGYSNWILRDVSAGKKGREEGM